MTQKFKRILTLQSIEIFIIELHILNSKIVPNWAKRFHIAIKKLTNIYPYYEINKFGNKTFSSAVKSGNKFLS